MGGEPRAHVGTGHRLSHTGGPAQDSRLGVLQQQREEQEAELLGQLRAAAEGGQRPVAAGTGVSLQLLSPGDGCSPA